MNLVTLAFRNLLRRPLRTTVVAISVGLAVGSALSLLALSDSIDNTAREGFDERGADLTITQRDASDFFSGFIPEELRTRLEQLNRVTEVAGELIMFAPVEKGRQNLLVGWSDNSVFLKKMPVSDGRIPHRDERRAAVMGVGAAAQYNKQLGDDLDILGGQFRVVGIANYASALNRSSIFVRLPDLQEAALRQGQVTAFHIQLEAKTAPAEVEKLKEEITGLGRVLVTPTDQLLQNDRNMAVMRAVARSVSWIALVMGALSVLSALLMAVQERTREIGIMMAIGWDRPHTMASIVIEGLLIGVCGCVLGVIVGYAASFLFSSMPMIGEYLSFKPTLHLVAPTLLSAIALCVVGSLYPAWRATSLTPADALRRA